MPRNTAVHERINLCVLIAGIIMLLVFYPNKQLSYDEPFSIMCSKGITNFSLKPLLDKNVISSAEINAQNTYHNVFQGGDSYYYIALHYFAMLFGSKLGVYMAFSLIWSVLALISFYWLCGVVLGKSLFKSVALALFFTDIQVINITYLIRPYTMGLCLVILSGVFLFKYLMQQKSPLNLLLMGMLAAFAVLTHYLTIYIAVAYVVILLYTDGMNLFSKKKLPAIMAPIALLAAYFLIHRPLATSYNTYQNYVKDGLHLKMYVSLKEVTGLVMKSIAINFKAIYPLLKDAMVIRIGAFLLVILAYLYGIKKTIKSEEERRKYHMLFVIGISGSVVLGALSFGMNNIMLFNFRYFVFAFPFCCIFITIFIKSLVEQRTVHVGIKVLFIAALVLPGLYKMAKRGFQNDGFPCNHIAVANEIAHSDVHKVSVPGLVDAIFLNCFLPEGYQLTYELAPKEKVFTLYGTNTNKQIPVVNSDLLALY